MSRIIFLLSICFICIVNLNGQFPGNLKLVTENVKVKYSGGDAGEILEKKIKYPQEAIISKIQGDVILSCIIDKNGRIDQLSVISSPDNSLSAASVSAVNELKDGWSPALVDDKPVDKTYLLVFRYRIFINTRPPDYTRMASKFAEKQKYEKALKTYDLAIKDNRFHYEYFEGRSVIREAMGDAEGAQMDKLKALELYDQILTVVDVITVGYTKTVVKRVVTTSPVY